MMKKTWLQDYQEKTERNFDIPLTTASQRIVHQNQKRENWTKCFLLSETKQSILCLRILIPSNEKVYLDKLYQEVTQRIYHFQWDFYKEAPANNFLSIRNKNIFSKKSDKDKKNWRVGIFQKEIWKTKWLHEKTWILQWFFWTRAIFKKIKDYAYLFFAWDLRVMKKKKKYRIKNKISWGRGAE